jgi:hypothetical protein
LRTLLKKMAATVSAETWERMLSYSVLKTHHHSVADAKVFGPREALWDECLLKTLAADTPVTFVEFGVHEGYSMDYFSVRNIHRESLFLGLDSFDGLPEAWGSMPKGSFERQRCHPVGEGPQQVLCRISPHEASTNPG